MSRGHWKKQSETKDGPDRWPAKYPKRKRRYVALKEAARGTNTHLNAVVDVAALRDKA
jgi:hypothetical protein